MPYLFKKLNVILFGIVSSVLCFGIAFGAQKETQKTEAQVKNEAPKATETPKVVETPTKLAPKTKEELAAEKAAQAEAEKKAEMIRVAKEKINNTTWNITLTQSTEKPNKEVIKDTLRFTDGKIESEHLVSKGFSPSNFTLRIKREDKAIWETMQTGKEGELAFWRGEVTRDPKDGTLGDVMTGVLSRHLNDKAKTVIDYTFISEEKGAITPEAPKEEPAVEAPPAAEGVQPTTPAISEEAPAVVEEAPAPVKPVEKQPTETKKEAPKKKGWGR